MAAKNTDALDSLILGADLPRWQKAAMVGAKVMMSPGGEGLTDTVVADRIKVLVAGHALEARGDVSAMRWSDVRIPVPVEGGHSS